MRLLYDLDGTVAHFDRKMDSILDTDYAHLPNIPRSGKQLSFNLWNGRTPEEQEAIRELMNRANFYKDLEPMAGAVEAVHEAEKLGHEIFFVSAPWVTNPTCAQDKFDWVAEHFGEKWRERLVLAKDKTIVSGDILFDDKEPIPNKERADWVQVYYTQPYNKDTKGLRINSWDRNEWVSIIEQVQEQKRLSRAHNITVPVHLLNEIKYVEFSR